VVEEEEEEQKRNRRIMTKILTNRHHANNQREEGDERKFTQRALVRPLSNLFTIIPSQRKIWAYTMFNWNFIEKEM